MSVVPSKKTLSGITIIDEETNYVVYVAETFQKVRHSVFPGSALIECKERVYRVIETYKERTDKCFLFIDKSIADLALLIKYGYFRLQLKNQLVTYTQEGQTFEIINDNKLIIDYHNKGDKGIFTVEMILINDGG